MATQRTLHFHPRQLCFLQVSGTTPKVPRAMNIRIIRIYSYCCFPVPCVVLNEVQEFHIKACLSQDKLPPSSSSRLKSKLVKTHFSKIKTNDRKNVCLHCTTKRGRFPGQEGQGRRRRLRDEAVRVRRPQICPPGALLLPPVALSKMSFSHSFPNRLVSQSFPQAAVRADAAHGTLASSRCSACSVKHGGEARPPERCRCPHVTMCSS